MSSRIMVVALAAALIPPPADAAVVAKFPAGDDAVSSAVIDVALPAVGVAVGPAKDDVSGAARSERQHPRDGAVTYSYLPRASSAAGLPGLGPLVLVKRHLLDEPAPVREASTAETTYTVVESRGMRRTNGAVPATIVLFATILCGLGGLAWWRRQHRAGA